MRKVSNLFALATMATVALAGCGGEGGGGVNEGDLLTPTEAQEVFALLFGLGFGVAQAPGPMASSGPMGVAFNESINETASCPGGGSVSISGNASGDIDPNTFNGNINLDITESISNCKVTSGGKNFTVNGNPNIRIDANITISGGGTSFGGTFGMTGGFSYTSDDSRSGSCAVNVSVNLSTFSASGSVCGQNITSAG